MVICESYMHKCSVSKDMKKFNNDKRKGHGSREGGGTFMSSTNHIKNKLTMIKGEGTW